MINDFLIENEEKNNCIICDNLTYFKIKCECNIIICDICLKNCLGRKRECPHCRRDIVEFDEWVEKWKNDELRKDLEDEDEDIFIRISADQRMMRDFINLHIFIYEHNFHLDHLPKVNFLVQTTLQTLFLQSQRELSGLLP